MMVFLAYLSLILNLAAAIVNVAIGSYGYAAMNGVIALALIIVIVATDD